MPPPMTIARACVGNSAMVLLELLPALLVALQVVTRVGGVVEIQGGREPGDGAPQRLAQQRGAQHRGEAAGHRSIRARTEIAAQEPRLELRRKWFVEGHLAT